MIEYVSITPLNDTVHDTLSQAMAQTLRIAQNELDEMSGWARGQFSDAQRDAMSRFITETMPAGFRQIDSRGDNERAFFQDPVNGFEYGVVTRDNPSKKETTGNPLLIGIITIVIGIIILWTIAHWILTAIF